MKTVLCAFRLPNDAVDEVQEQIRLLEAEHPRRTWSKTWLYIRGVHLALAELRQARAEGKTPDEMPDLDEIRARFRGG